MGCLDRGGAVLPVSHVSQQRSVVRFAISTPLNVCVMGELLEVQNASKRVDKSMGAERLAVLQLETSLSSVPRVMTPHWGS